MARYSRGSWGDDFGGYPPYVPVAQRKKKAAQAAATLVKKGQKVSPVQIEGRTIARTFWGKAWCDNLESYSDFENRLPRGRSYVRNGSVVDLQITTGKVTALVQGSSMYKVNIAIQPVEAARWTSVVGECSGKIDSVVELLAGKLSGGVMEVITRKGAGLFPVPAHIHMKCSCPDYATLCKHVAAVLYGVGARLDHRPELLFELRSADPTQLVSVAAAGGILRGGKGAEKGKSLGSADLSSVFGIDIEDGAVEVAPVAVKPVKAAPRAAVKAAPRAAVKAAPPAPAKAAPRAVAKASPAAVAKAAPRAVAKAAPAAVAKAAPRAVAKATPRAVAKAAPRAVAKQNPSRSTEDLAVAEMVARLRARAPGADPEALAQIVALARSVV